MIPVQKISHGEITDPGYRRHREESDDFERLNRRKSDGGQRESQPFEKLYAEVLNGIRGVASHEKGIITPADFVPAPERHQRFQMMEMQAPVLFDDRLIVEETAKREKQTSQA